MHLILPKCTLFFRNAPDSRKNAPCFQKCTRLSKKCTPLFQKCTLKNQKCTRAFSLGAFFYQNRCTKPLKSLKSIGFEAFFVYIKNFLRQNGPNRIFRRRLLSLLSHLFCKFHAGYCRFIALSVSESQQNVPKSAITKALKFASAKPFLHPQMTKV